MAERLLLLWGFRVWVLKVGHVRVFKNARVMFQGLGFGARDQN